MCHFFAITWQSPWVERRRGGYSLGGESKGIIWIHLHLFTWTPWANRNDFHLKTERRGEKAQRPTGFEVWGRVMKARFTPCEGMQITFCAPSKGCLVNYLRLQIELLSNLTFGMEGRRFLAQSLYLFCIVRCKFFFFRVEWRVVDYILVSAVL